VIDEIGSSVQSMISPAALAGFARQLGTFSQGRTGRTLFPVLIFVFTTLIGLVFLDLVIGSHLYHAWIERTFFQPPRNQKASDDGIAASLPMPLKVEDLRKIAHNIDKFEKSAVEGLADGLHDLIIMKQDGARMRAVAAFAARITAHRASIKHTIYEIQTISDSGLEGLASDFAAVAASVDRLKQTSDVLAVATAELEAEPDQVMLHDVQKQFDGLLEDLDIGMRTTAAK
jgi:hypothetical protein